MTTFVPFIPPAFLLANKYFIKNFRYAKNYCSAKKNDLEGDLHFAKTDSEKKTEELYKRYKRDKPLKFHYWSKKIWGWSSVSLADCDLICYNFKLHKIADAPLKHEVAHLVNNDSIRGELIANLGSIIVGALGTVYLKNPTYPIISTFFLLTITYITSRIFENIYDNIAEKKADDFMIENSDIEELRSELERIKRYAEIESTFSNYQKFKMFIKNTHPTFQSRVNKINKKISFFSK